MTSAQVEYLKLLEEQRHNKAVEEETARYNRSQDFRNYASGAGSIAKGAVEMVPLFGAAKRAGAKVAQAAKQANNARVGRKFVKNWQRSKAAKDVAKLAGVGKSVSPIPPMNDVVTAVAERLSGKLGFEPVAKEMGLDDSTIQRLRRQFPVETEGLDRRMRAEDIYKGIQALLAKDGTYNNKQRGKTNRGSNERSN
nr:putative ORF1 [Marmot picobirnavirus]